MSANSSSIYRIYLMANKSKRGRRSRVKQNPMQRREGTPRPMVSFDGTVVDSAFYTATTPTVLGAAKDYHFVDCSNSLAINRGVSTITGLYNEYKYLQASMEYVPSVGPASADAPGRIHVAYIDNPEKIVSFIAAAAGATALSYVRSCKNVRSYNLWERFTYNVPLTNRRKLFDTNGTMTTTPGVDEIDRCVQGAIIIAIESISAVITVGTYHFRSRCVVRGLDYAIPT